VVQLSGAGQQAKLIFIDGPAAKLIQDWSSGISSLTAPASSNSLFDRQLLHFSSGIYRIES
jgi:hypothetical protein